MPNPLTYIVIVNWNGRDKLCKCLFSLYSHTPDQAFKVIVVDNGSTDGSELMLRQNFNQVYTIFNRSNLGFSAANNQGIRFAMANGAEQVFLLNNDVEIEDSLWLQSLTNIFESDSKIGIVGCKLIYPDGKIQHAGGIIKLSGAFHRGEREIDNGQYEKVEFMDYVTGAALLIKIEVIRKIGLLDEGFTPLYFEDTDWCVRARLFGYKIAYTPHPTLIHHCGTSAKKIGPAKNMFYFKRSSIRFFLLNFQPKEVFLRMLKFELASFLACFIGWNRKGNFPLTLKRDVSGRLSLLLQAWAASIFDLKGILVKRQQRFPSMNKNQGKLLDYFFI